MNNFLDYLKNVGEIGFVDEVVNFLVYVNGLPSAMLNEIIVFESGEFGRVLSLNEANVEVLMFSKNTIRVGTRVARTNKLLDIPVGIGLLGRVIDPLGNPLDALPLKKVSQRREVDVIPQGIETRKRISKPLTTGVIVVDLILPLGKGQRQLIIGDRKTGKTSFIMQTVISQAKQGSICIYVAIGKKTQDIKKIEQIFDKSGILDKTILVASSSEDPAGVIYITPYSAMTIAEYFRDQGKDVLLVLDDLSTHARFCREISLLAKRFPGRNSYPGDIFYTHARLLERAGNFATENGEVAITCLPVVEAVQGDLTGYIQTNIMSITDGYIYFDNDLFSKGRRPAINLFLSVTRVGKQTESVLRRDISRELISFLTLFERMQRFIHFGAELNSSIKQTLSTGEKILHFFKQSSIVILDSDLQIFIFSMLWIGAWQDKSIQDMTQDMQRIEKTFNQNSSFRNTIAGLINNSQSFNDFLNTLRSKLNSIIALVA